MKKYLLTLCIAVTMGGVYAQEGFKLGIQAGIPFNDFDEQVSIAVALDIGYMHALGEVVDLGIISGIIHGFPETFQTSDVTIDFPSIQFVPLTAAIRIWPSNSFSFGGNAGYAFGLNEGNEGGVYFRPIIGYLLGAKTEINVSYTSISLDTASWTTATLGILYTF